VYRSRVRKPFWIALGIGILAWIVLGALIPPEKTPLNDIFDVASVATFMASFLFVAIYTIAGFVGPHPRPHWWKNEVGTYLVLSIGSIMFIVGPAVFAVIFNEGQINTWWWAWAWIGGHLLGAIMIGELSYLWFKSAKRQAGDREIQET
jgi:hypothetical protein